MSRKERLAGEIDALVESISRRRLINILNYVNFKGGDVVVNLRKIGGGGKVSLRAVPAPCSGEVLRLTWAEEAPPDIESGYSFTDFFVDNGSRALIVNGASNDIDPSGATVLLPWFCRATSRRRRERFGSAPVLATLTRNSSEAVGILQDFGGGFLKVRVAAAEIDALLKGRSRAALSVSLSCAGTTVYEGKGFVRRRIALEGKIDVVVALAPYAANESGESQEVALDPAPIATYRHPLSDRIIRLDVLKASYNTFVVKEDRKHEALFAGLAVPEMKIDFGTGDSAQCAVRVTGGEGGTWFLSVLDMPILDQRKLFSFLEKEKGMSSGASGVIDPDDLIEFFFEAGFVYPSKYISLADSRDRLKAILSRLYVDRPSISQHFVHYSKGVIEGHICMVRFYERAWVVHHHTALGGAGAGSAVLTQIFRYIHSYSHLPSTGMDYAMTYYRPENRFPDRVLGGFSRSLKKPSLCSVDSFAYLHLHFDDSSEVKRYGEKWQLHPVSRDDLQKLEIFYDKVSGGLTLKAFGLEAPGVGRETIDLDEEFKKAGLRRRKSFFSLSRNGKLKAVVMTTDSDAGLNMSNLMKCIHVFIVDKKGLSFDLLMNQLNRLSHLYEEQEIPVLLFPLSYMNDQGEAYEKTYDLLVFRASIVKDFIEFTKRLTDRTIRRRYVTPAQHQEGDAIEP